MVEINQMQVIMVSSIPGGGKTTFTKELLRQNPEGVAVSADDYFVGSDGKYRYIKDGVHLAHKRCQNLFAYHVDRGTPLIIVDNTNLESKHMVYYHDLAERMGYSFMVVRLNCDPADAFFRQRHNVPEDEFAKMVAMWNKRDVRDEWEVKELDYVLGSQNLKQVGQIFLFVVKIIASG